MQDRFSGFLGILNHFNKAVAYRNRPLFVESGVRFRDEHLGIAHQAPQ